MASPYRALCAELVDELEDWIAYGDALAIEKAHNLVDRARALLDQQEPQPSAAVEVAASLIELRSTVMGLGQMGMHVAAKRVERAADLLQRQHPQPVAVSERLPGPEDCDAEENCWWFDNDDYKWCLESPYMGTRLLCWTHWLPANALPTPEATKD